MYGKIYWLKIYIVDKRNDHKTNLLSAFLSKLWGSVFYFHKSDFKLSYMNTL